MSTCTTDISPFQAEQGELDVSEKYIQLMQDTLSEDSLYIRAKDTLAVMFKDLTITEPEKAQLIINYVSNMTIGLSQSAMSTALAWSKEERDGRYELAKTKADTEASMANYELTKSKICETDKSTELVCANVKATMSASIRENGYIVAYESDGCTPKTLDETGLKWHQARQSEADAYSRYADAFRQSGVVQIGTDTGDSTKKGLSGDADGNTYQKIINAERLRISYEDSKRNQAANGSSTMIASMLSAEISPNEADIQRWRDAIDYLNTSHSSTNTP